jgi:hypothetical protein
VRDDEDSGAVGGGADAAEQLLVGDPSLDGGPLDVGVADVADDIGAAGL